MKIYKKIIGDKVQYLPADQIIVIKGDFQFINPTEEMILEDGWEEYKSPEPTLEDIKRIKRDEILSYDSSTSVNIFYIQDLPVWLDKATRAGLKLRFEAEIALGKTETTLWYEGLQFLLSLDEAIQMLYAIEVYASACYDNTQKHLAAVDRLETMEEVQSYNYFVDYPEKLNF